jgi:hypothetical protein
MSSAPGPRITYRKTASPGSGQYEVSLDDAVIGTVGRFSLSAGQFGSQWVATTPAGARSGTRTSRDAAARWLVELVGAGRP